MCITFPSLPIRCYHGCSTTFSKIVMFGSLGLVQEFIGFFGLPLQHLLLPFLRQRMAFEQVNAKGDTLLGSHDLYLIQTTPPPRSRRQQNMNIHTATYMNHCKLQSASVSIRAKCQTSSLRGTCMSTTLFAAFRQRISRKHWQGAHVGLFNQESQRWYCQLLCEGKDIAFVSRTLVR